MTDVEGAWHGSLQFDVHGAKVDSVAALPGAIRDALAATKAGKTAILNVVLKA